MSSTDLGGASAESEGALEIIVRSTGGDGQQIVSIAGEIDVATSSAVRVALADALDAAECVIVDLSGTTFIDSSGLGVLVGALKRSREMDRRLLLRGLQTPVMRVFEITGLATAFSVED